MSVICKMYIQNVRDLGGKKLVLAQCIAENEVMAAYNPDAEDKLFSHYSPSGSAEFVVDDCVQLPRQGIGAYQDKIYLVFVRAPSRPDFKKALTFASLRVFSTTDYGGTSKQFDMTANYSQQVPYPQTAQFAHRIMIDNPKASEQFEPGQSDWWVAVYDASKYNMTETLADAL